jgi:stringent starvation protein B
MNSSKPYIIRALHEWISDNNCTPLVLVSSEYDGVEIPAGISKDGKVVLNISYGATKNLQLIEEGVMFDARFSGVSENIFVPLGSILAIYARENGQGMMFSEKDDLPEPPKNNNKDQPKTDKKSKKTTNIKKTNKKSFLKVVK